MHKATNAIATAIPSHLLDLFWDVADFDDVIVLAFRKRFIVAKISLNSSLASSAEANRSSGFSLQHRSIKSLIPFSFMDFIELKSQLPVSISKKIMPKAYMSDAYVDFPP